MAQKTRNKVEQALYDLQTARKMIKKAAGDLEDRCNSLENHSRWVEKQLVEEEDFNTQLKNQYEAKFQEIFGVNIDFYLDGFRFERHVVWWMNRYFSQYELKIWQGDKCYKPYEDSKRISASWNTYPDLIYVDTNNKKVVALECKYRSNGKISLEQRQFENYRNFEKQIGAFMNVKTKVYVMVGTGGSSSDRPDNMYCVPLEVLRNERELDLYAHPQYLVMERGDVGQEIRIHKDNIPF